MIEMKNYGMHQNNWFTLLITTVWYTTFLRSGKSKWIQSQHMKYYMYYWPHVSVFNSLKFIAFEPLEHDFDYDLVDSEHSEKRHRVKISLGSSSSWMVFQLLYHTSWQFSFNWSIIHPNFSIQFVTICIPSQNF